MIGPAIEASVSMSIADFFTFLNGLMAVLFVAVLLVIFVSEYDRLRREKS